MKHTEQSLYEGLKQVKPGNRIGDVGYAISEYAKKYNLGVVKELVGHGIGNHVHEDPDVPNYGKPGVITSYSIHYTKLYELELFATTWFFACMRVLLDEVRFHGP